MISPGVSLVMAAYAVGTSAPSLIFGRSITGTSGGRMLETLIRLMLPMPAASSALSKALRVVPPSACPAVAAAIVIVCVIRSSSPWDLASNHHAATRAERNLSSLYRAVVPTQEKSDPTTRHRVEVARASVIQNHPKVRFFLAMGVSGPYSETDF